jgi:hypothetical protein
MTSIRHTGNSKRWVKTVQRPFTEYISFSFKSRSSHLRDKPSVNNSTVVYCSWKMCSSKFAELPAHTLQNWKATQSSCWYTLSIVYTTYQTISHLKCSIHRLHFDHSKIIPPPSLIPVKHDVTRSNIRHKIPLDTTELFLQVTYLCLKFSTSRIYILQKRIICLLCLLANT